MLNKVMIIGHVGQEPEVRYTGNATNGTKVAQIRVATTERYKDKDGKAQRLGVQGCWLMDGLRG